MKIGLILYLLPDRDISYYKVPISLFKKAARVQGHTLKVLHSDACELVIFHQGLDLYYKGRPFPHLDCIIPRVGISRNLELELLLNEQMLLMGYTLLNDCTPFRIAKNKISTMQLLTKAGIPVTNSVVIKNLENMDNAVNLVGGFPVIVKLPIGSQGKGVAIVETRRSLLSSVGMIMSQGVNTIIIQEYISEANGKDLRVFVAGGKVVAAMERTAAEGDFRSNIHQGGQGQVIEITKKEEEIAIKTAKVLELDVAGVDLLRTKRGPIVMEVNSNPGVEGITAVTGIDVAGKVIEALIKKAKKKAAKK